MTSDAPLPDAALADVASPELSGAPVPLRPTAPDLLVTLQLVADAIVESIGFEVAVVNLVDDVARTAWVAAVAGPAEVRTFLLDQVQSLDSWDLLLEESEEWGDLRFLDHRTSVADPADMLTWIPDLTPLDHPDAWHPDDALFAWLTASDGSRLGILSVDLPRDGMRPQPATVRSLSAFAVTASLAIEHARLAADSRRSVRRFQAVFDSSPVAIALVGTDDRFLSVNAAFCRFLGRGPEALVGVPPLQFTHPDDVAATRELTREVRRAVHPPVSRSIEKRYLLPDGDVVWGRLHLASLGADEAGTVIAQIEDVTSRKQDEGRLVRQARFDPLTDLPNRSSVMHGLREALSADLVAGALTAVFFCDLDRLKLVNDGFGHAVGDAYLQAVAGRLREAVRGNDIVGRLSGDEFVVVVPGLSSPTEAIGLAGRVLEHVRSPLRLAGSGFSPSLSLGIAYSSGPGTSADELLAQADAAMYRAKTQERGSWHVYDPTLRSSAVEHLQLRADVGVALEREQLRLHYQPVVRLADRAVVGHEALLRWEHPRRGLLVPGQFLDVVLDSEYEAPVTDWVLARACADAARRPAASRRVSVNVSSVQVGRRDLPEVVARCLADSGLAPGELVLELTEDRLLSRTDGAELLERLSQAGAELAVDDFGTGYAGLGYLQRFPALDVVKLDRSFVAGLGEDPVCEQVVRAMVALCAGCGLQLLAEGVETTTQLDLLVELGVELAQGYLLGRPAALD